MHVYTYFKLNQVLSIFANKLKKQQYSQYKTHWSIALSRQYRGIKTISSAAPTAIGYRQDV